MNNSGEEAVIFEIFEDPEIYDYPEFWKPPCVLDTGNIVKKQIRASVEFHQNCEQAICQLLGKLQQDFLFDAVNAVGDLLQPYDTFSSFLTQHKEELPGVNQNMVWMIPRDFTIFVVLFDQQNHMFRSILRVNRKTLIGSIFGSLSHEVSHSLDRPLTRGDAPIVFASCNNLRLPLNTKIQDYGSLILPGSTVYFQPCSEYPFAETQVDLHLLYPSLIINLKIKDFTPEVLKKLGKTFRVYSARLRADQEEVLRDRTNELKAQKARDLHERYVRYEKALLESKYVSFQEMTYNPATQKE